MVGLDPSLGLLLYHTIPEFVRFIDTFYHSTDGQYPLQSGKVK